MQRIIIIAGAEYVRAPAHTEGLCCGCIGWAREQICHQLPCTDDTVIFIEAKKESNDIS